MIKAPIETIIWIIKKHITEYSHGPTEFANWNTYDDTKRVAYLLGVPRRNRKKVDLWTDILKVIN